MKHYRRLAGQIRPRLRDQSADHGNDAHVDFLIVGRGMFGAAIARHLAPHAAVTVVGPEAP